LVRLDDAEGKSLEDVEKGAYMRCFGDLHLSHLLSRVQSLLIKNGYELERIVIEATKRIQIDDLDQFLSQQIMYSGVRIATKKTVTKSVAIEGHSIEPDFLVFQRADNAQNCYVIELKDGHEFDTKSSAKEHQNLHTFISKNAYPLQHFQIYSKICGFNADSKEIIRTGFKNKIALEQAMTGEEFCALIGLDYKSIVKKRKEDQVTNFDQFVDELLLINSVKQAILGKIAADS